MSQEANKGPMTVEEVNEASKIVVVHLQRAIEECQKLELHPAAAAQAGVQMCLRAYADLLGDDANAIRQTRQFLDQWEADLDDAGEDNVH